MLNLFVHLLSPLVEFSLSYYLPKVKVLKTYKQLNTIVLKHYDEDDQQIIGCPSQEQVC